MNYCQFRNMTIKRMANAGGVEGLYTPVRYIESSGAQYLDTGLYATPYTAVAMHAMLFNATAQTRLFSTEADGSGVRFAAYISGSVKWSYIFSTGNYVNTISTYNNDRRTVTLDGYNQKYFVDSINRDSFTRPSSTSTGTIKLFSTGTYGYATGRLYGCKILEHNELIRDYIPCYRNSDKKPGMYDTITGEFLENLGTGAFTAGPDKTNLPNDYQELEYAQGNGAQSEPGGNYAYIDTGVPYFADFEIDVQLGVSGQNAVFCGVSYDASLKRKTDATPPNYSFYNSSSDYYVSNVDVTQRATLAWKNNRIYVNNEYIQDFEKQNTSGNFKLFGAGIYYKNVKIYSCKLWDTQGQLIRHFVPVVRWYDNTVGMYDTLNGVFYTPVNYTLIRGSYIN